MPNEKIAAGQQKEPVKQQGELHLQDERYDRHARKREVFRGYNKNEWEDRLFEINGVRNVLRHKSIASQDSTDNFVFVQNTMQLNPGLTLHLEERMGQVVAFEEGADQSVQMNPTGQQDQTVQPNQAAQGNGGKGLIFSGFGGKLRFQSASMPQIDEQELAVTTIEIPAAERGQTAKAKISASLLDTVTIEPSPGMKLELKNGQYTNAGNAERAALHFDTAVWLDGKQLGDHIRLKYDDAGLQAEEGEKALLDVSQFDYAKKKQEGLRKDETFADAQLQMRLILDEDAGVHIGMDVIHAVAEREIEGFSTRMYNYSYGAKTYESAEVATKINTGLDKESKEPQKDEPVDLLDFKLEAGRIEEDGFEKDTEGKQILSHAYYMEKTLHKEETKDGNLLKRRIFTRDGFAELQVRKMQFRKNEDDAAKIVGTGNFKLQEIPYTLTTRKGKELKGIAYSPDEPFEGIEFTIDNQGLLSADLEEEDAEMNLKKVFVKKFENAGESFVKKVKLNGLRIENGYLKVSSVRMDRGLGIDQELGEKEEEDKNAQKTLKDIFGECKFSATIANTTENVQMTPKGIEVQQDDKYKLGTVGVEGLFGFLSGEIDYPEGTVSASAEKSAETPEAPSFLNIPKLNGNLGVGVSIPIPSTPLSVELGVNPSASIGGKVSAEISRGKSFGEPWGEQKEELEIKGGLEAEAKAGIEAYMGVAVGVAGVASAALKLNGKLGAELKGALELKSKMEKEQGQKMKQAENFKFSGSIEGALKAGLSLSNDVKLLFWKAQLFEIKLAEKDLGKLRFKGGGFKEKDAEGLTEGWHFDDMQFTAEFLKQKAQIDLKHGIEGAFSLRDAKLNKLGHLLEEAEENAKLAWEALALLKEQKDDMLYIVSVAEKEALEKQIQNMTAEVIGKIKVCLELLDAKKTLLEKTVEKQKQEVTKKETAFLQADENTKEADYMMQAAVEGGFDAKKYMYEGSFKNEFFKIAVASMGVAMLLGEYRRGETDFRKSAVKKEDVSALLGEYHKDVNLKTVMESRAVGNGRSLSDFNFFQYPYYYDLLLKRENEQRPLTVKELLTYAISGHGPESEQMPVDSYALTSLLELCLKANLQKPAFSKETSRDIRLQKEKQYKEAQKYAMGTVQKRFDKVFGRQYTTLSQWSIGKETMDIFRRMDTLKGDKQSAEAAYQSALRQLNLSKESIKKIDDKKTEYEGKLNTLGVNALGALQDKNFDSGSAAMAVQILQEDYSKKMKDGKEILRSLSTDNESRDVVQKVMKKPLNEVQSTRV